MKEITSLYFLYFIHIVGIGQNVGIGINNPQAKLHVNGNIRLQQGVAVNTLSTDSTFANASHNTIPTEKAIKDYFQKGFFTGTDLYMPGSLAPFARDYAEVNSARCVYVQDNYAYVVSGTDQGGNGRLSIYDIGDPDNIIEKSFITSNGAQCVFVKGNFAFVSSYSAGLLIYDISNSNAIVARGSIQTNIDNGKSVFVQGNFAYVTSYANNRLCVFDVSNPDVIVARGFIETNLDAPFSVYVKDNYAYVVNLNSNGNEWFSIFDISNPDNIIPKGFTDVNLNNPTGVSVQGNYAYVVNYFNSRIAIFDISNPDLIIPKDFIDNPTVHGNTSVFIQGNYAFVASGLTSNGRLTIYNISNPDDISLKSWAGADLNTPRSVFVVGNYAYVASYGNNRLSVLDLDINKTFSITPNGISVSPALWRNSEIAPQKIYALKNVGIGINDPHAPLSFSATPGKKIIFYQDNSKELGVSVETLALDYRLYCSSPAQRIIFGYETGPAFTERMRINGSGNVIDVAGGAYCTGTTWNNASDSTLKENIRLVNKEDILTRISRLPISTWNYKTDRASITHIGPMAQDFKEIFHIGNDDRTISTIDPSGVALAGIQALLEKINKQQEQIEELRKELASFKNK